MTNAALTEQIERATEHFARCEENLARAERAYMGARERYNPLEPVRRNAWNALQTARAARDNAEAELTELEARR